MMQDDCRKVFERWQCVNETYRDGEKYTDKFLQDRWIGWQAAWNHRPTLPEGAVEAGARAIYEFSPLERSDGAIWEDVPWSEVEQNHPYLSNCRLMAKACLQAAVPVLMGEVRRLESAVRLAARWFQLNLGAEERPLEADLRGMLEALKEALSAPGDAGEGR